MTKITLTVGDGKEMWAHEAKPDGKPRGGLVVLQEIFGVNPHIRAVADGFAADGYHVVAPGLFERAERGVATGYEKADAERGVALRNKIRLEDTLLDITAAMERLKPSGKIGLVGYCWGGSLAWISACRLPGLAAAVGYYGGMVAKHLDEKPRCPVMLHYGEQDHGIPMADVDKIREATNPAMVQVFAYPGAGHAFNRDVSPAWHEPSAKLARERSLAFFRKYVG